MVAYNCHSLGKIVSRLLLFLCRLIIYDPMIYRLPLILIIASASRNIAQKCHPHHETFFKAKGRVNNYYLKFRSLYDLFSLIVTILVEILKVGSL